MHSPSQLFTLPLLILLCKLIPLTHSFQTMADVVNLIWLVEAGSTRCWVFCLCHVLQQCLSCFVVWW